MWLVKENILKILNVDDNDSLFDLRLDTLVAI